MKIYARERQKVGEGVESPKFRIVAVTGGQIQIEATHFRKFELEQEEEDELSNRRKHDFSTWIMLISATILFLALVFLIRSVL